MPAFWMLKLFQVAIGVVLFIVIPVAARMERYEPISCVIFPFIEWFRSSWYTYAWLAGWFGCGISASMTSAPTMAERE